MVHDNLATVNPDLGTGNFDDLIGIGSGSHAMAIDTERVAGDDRDRARQRPVPERRARRRAHAVPERHGHRRAACS